MPQDWDNHHDDARNDKNDRQEQQAALPLVDECLVGLSPAYWAHVPLSIRQVHDLQLLQGINVLVQPPSSPSSASSKEPSPRLLPLSKCELVGVIVAVESRGDSVIYVLDDGTGLIDCLYWMQLPPQRKF